MASPDAQAVEIGRPPNLADLNLDGHGIVSRLWQGVAGAGGIGIEISEVQLNQAPTARRLRDAWRARRGGSSRPVIVFASTPEGVLVCGPDGSPPPVASLSPAIAGQIFRRVIDQPPVQASLAALSLIARAQGSGSVPGFRNRSLVSTHFVTNVIRREQRREWTDAAGAGRRALGEAGEPMLRALGYDLKAIRPKEYQLQDDGQAVAVVHVYDDGVNLDRVLAGQSAPPASHALQRAAELRVGHALPWAGTPTTPTTWSSTTRAWTSMSWRPFTRHPRR